MYLCATIETTDAMKSRPYKFLRNENMENDKFAPTYHGAPQQLFDRQGNPVNEDGTLKTETIADVDELTDRDFSTPYRNVELPQLPENVGNAIGANGRPVVIKKNIFEKNRKDHPELTPGQSRDTALRSLYTRFIRSKSADKQTIQLGGDKNQRRKREKQARSIGSKQQETPG